MIYEHVAISLYGLLNHIRACCHKLYHNNACSDEFPVNMFMSLFYHGNMRVSSLSP